MWIGRSQFAARLKVGVTFKPGGVTEPTSTFRKWRENLARVNGGGPRCRRRFGAEKRLFRMFLENFCVYFLIFEPKEFGNKANQIGFEVFSSNMGLADLNMIWAELNQIGFVSNQVGNGLGRTNQDWMSLRQVVPSLLRLIAGYLAQGWLTQTWPLAPQGGRQLMLPISDGVATVHGVRSSDVWPSGFCEESSCYVAIWALPS